MSLLNHSRTGSCLLASEKIILLCLLDHLLSLALDDDLFAAESLRNVRGFFCAKIPPEKKSYQLKTKQELFDISVFYGAKLALDGYRTRTFCNRVHSFVTSHY